MTATDISGGENFEESSKSCSNLLRRTLEPAPVAGFSFMKTYGGKMGTKKYIDYKPAEINNSGKKWYVWYSFRNPETGKFKRFRVYEDLNRIKSVKERNHYAHKLKAMIDYVLSTGFNPFRREPVMIVKTWSIQQGVLFFKQKWADKGIENSSYYKYELTADRFLRWLIKYQLQYRDIEQIGEQHIEQYLEDHQKSNKWGGRSYNNELKFLNTIFIFLQKKGLIKANPCAFIERKKVVINKHRYYDQKKLDKLIEILKAEDPYLYFACQVVYYLCIRSEKELKLFKVGNIFPDRRQVLIKGSDSKTGRDRFIPMPDEMFKVFQERKILDYDPDDYVFSVPHKNKFIRDGEPGKDPFGRGFFSKRFGKLRVKAGLSSDFTIYGFKHTRVIHLKVDGVPDQDIMALTGHSDYVSFSKYLRDLGLTVNAETINLKTRKI